MQLSLGASLKGAVVSMCISSVDKTLSDRCQTPSCGGMGRRCVQIEAPLVSRVCWARQSQGGRCYRAVMVTGCDRPRKLRINGNRTGCRSSSPDF